MKRSRHNKVVGLALGEQSLLVAEVIAGEPPSALRFGELVYKQDVSLLAPEALGRALKPFLEANGFTARTAVVGLPARWLLVKAKDVPPVDPATLADMLRLQAEGEFSADLKDLVYEYAGSAATDSSRSVLLIATPRKYVDASTRMCEAAGLRLLTVTSSAVALGAATVRGLGDDALVLAAGPTGGELTAQSGGAPTAIRHFRAGERAFAGELRRVVSALPANGPRRQMVVWDAGLPAGSVDTSLGIPVHCGDLPVLGVATAGPAVNGKGRAYAAAVALALGAVIGLEPFDFLHSRLAPPKVGRIPRGAGIAILTAIVLIACIFYGYTDLQHLQAGLDTSKSRLTGSKGEISSASAFVSKVSFAQGWYGGNPRYLGCLRDLTAAIPEDGQTYATSLIIRENIPAPGNSSAGPATAPKPGSATTLNGSLNGRTLDQQHAQVVLDRLKHIPALSEVKSGGTQDAGRNGVTFTITFTYTPPRTSP